MNYEYPSGQPAAAAAAAAAGKDATTVINDKGVSAGAFHDETPFPGAQTHSGKKKSQEKKAAGSPPPLIDWY